MKYSELTNKTTEECLGMIDQKNKEISELRRNLAFGKESDSSKIKKMKKEIAQIKTYISLSKDKK